MCLPSQEAQTWLHHIRCERSPKMTFKTVWLQTSKYWPLTQTLSLKDCVWQPITGIQTYLWCLVSCPLFINTVPCDFTYIIPYAGNYIYKWVSISLLIPLIWITFQFTFLIAIKWKIVCKKNLARMGKGSQYLIIPITCPQNHTPSINEKWAVCLYCDRFIQ